MDNNQIICKLEQTAALNDSLKKEAEMTAKIAKCLRGSSKTQITEKDKNWVKSEISAAKAQMEFWEDVLVKISKRKKAK